MHFNEYYKGHMLPMQLFNWEFSYSALPNRDVILIRNMFFESNKVKTYSSSR